MSTTINNGLKYVRGEYLLWPDADDWFDDDTTITSMVYVLNNHQYSCVRVMANYVDEITMTKTPIAIQNKSKEDLFEDFYYWNNNIWAPAGSHMIRTAKLFSELTDRSIFTNKDGGQNYQLLLPVLYKNRCYTIQKHIYNILVRNGSHSRGAYANYSHQIKRWYDSVELIIHTINNISSMDNQTKIWYSAMTHQRYYLIMANTAKRHHKPIEYFRFIIKYFFAKIKILINCSL